MVTNVMMPMAKPSPMTMPRDWDTGEPGGRTKGFGTFVDPKRPTRMSLSLEFSGGWPKSAESAIMVTDSRDSNEDFTMLWRAPN